MVHCPICGPREALEQLLEEAERRRYLAWEEAEPTLQKLEDAWKRIGYRKAKFEDLLVPAPRHDRVEELNRLTQVLARAETAVAVLVPCKTTSWEDVLLDEERLKVAHERQLKVFQDPDSQAKLRIPKTEADFKSALRKQNKIPKDIFEDFLTKEQLESYWCVMVIELVSIKGLLKKRTYNKADLGYVKGKREGREDKIKTALRELEEEAFLPPEQFEARQRELLGLDWVIFVHRSAPAAAAAEPTQPTEPVHEDGEARGAGGGLGGTL